MKRTDVKRNLIRNPFSKFPATKIDNKWTLILVIGWTQNRRQYISWTNDDPSDWPTHVTKAE